MIYLYRDDGCQKELISVNRSMKEAAKVAADDLQNHVDKLGFEYIFEREDDDNETAGKENP